MTAGDLGGGPTDAPDSPFSAFADRHRVEHGVRLVERPGGVRLDPLTLDLRAQAAGLLGFYAAIGVAVHYYRLFHEQNRAEGPLLAATAALLIPAVLFRIRKQNRAERAMGPLLDVDLARRTVELPRDGLTLGLDRVEGLTLCTGKYDWMEHEWEWAGSLSLVARAGRGGPTRFPIVLQKTAREVERLAEALGMRLGWPVDRTVGPLRPDGKTPDHVQSL